MTVGLTWIERLLLRIFCAAGLVMLGFAHQLPNASPSFDPHQVAAYALPDGSTPTLCLPSATDHVDHGGHHPSQAIDCEACRLTTSLVPVVPRETGGIAVSFVAIQADPAQAETLFPRLFPPQICPRGPPGNAII